eukprot:354229-Chlamydomonas_euryale.AAC.2
MASAWEGRCGAVRLGRWHQPGRDGAVLMRGEEMAARGEGRGMRWAEAQGQVPQEVCKCVPHLKNARA